MYVYFGNVSIEEFIKRTGYDLSNEDIKILKAHRQDNTSIDINSNNFHIFDMPFHINVSPSFKEQLIDILTKYENVTPSKEPLSISVIEETEKEKEKRIKREQEEKLRKERNENPNSIWNIKWHMLVPVIIDGKEFYYGCFINTYTKGKANIPDTIHGNAYIYKDEEGFHGTFNLTNPEIENDANEHNDWNYVIGLGLYKLNGNYIGSGDYTFDRVDFSIEECINRRKEIEGVSCGREIHFDRIEE